MSQLLKSPLIKAGAGTGKTETLIRSIYKMFHQFALDEGREPKLIVCTFTRKASQELKERLFRQALKEIENSTQKENLLKTPAFLNYLRSSFLQVSTIDGILNRFLKKHSSFINLNPDFEISYSAYNEKLFDSLAEEFIYNKHFSLLRKFPYSQLRDIFLSYFRNRLKYRNISFYDGDDFEDFEKEREKISFLIESKDSFSSFFKQNPDLQCLDSNKLKEWIRKDEKFCADEFTPIFEELKKAGEEFFPIFLEKKKTSSLLDIEDLLLFSYDLLKKSPSVAKTFSEEWDYWFIDEYQDTSWLQEQVIQEFTKFKNVFCVGDPGQSIYSFRGADPEVFNRRQKKLKGAVKKLEENYRSSAQLIDFYNDFFTKEIFMKFKIPLNKKLSSIDPYLSFLTYNKQEERQKENVFQALYHYIQKLRSQGVDYDKIAVLSSRNEDIFQITNYLRGKELPVVLYSSKNFSQNRMVLDSLFLLKFLINPYDDVNLKALLRTPYFRLNDQDLADSSYQYNSNKENCLSFWSFIKDKYKESLFVRQLKAYLDSYEKVGLFESFKKALFDSALMDLAYWRDPTSFSLANIWKLLDLLKNESFSELQLFYELLDQEEDRDHLKSARPCEESSSLSLMTIHKSKGLEFEHVILLDFSMDTSSLQTGRKLEEMTVFDKKRNKMAVAVPIGGREKKKIRSYGHEIYNQIQNQIKISEAERLYYVAMTRAKESLAVFLPHGDLPKKNSWLREVDYFSKIKGLLQRDEKSKTWILNPGVYQQAGYNLTVLECHTLSKKPQWITGSSKEVKSKTDSQGLKTVSAVSDLQAEFISSRLNVKSKNVHFSQVKDQIKSKNETVCSDPVMIPDQSIPSNQLVIPAKEGISPKPANVSAFLDVSLKKEMNNNYSSKDFIQFMTQTETQKEFDFSLVKTKNILFKTSLGSQLHFFLQKLFYFPSEKLDSLIKASPFLSEENQEKIKKALLYVQSLKEPDMSLFFKTGYSEWPFKFQKNGVILKGQIDLWSWLDGEICLFDYKSSVSSSVKNQLIFYSWILDQMYRPKALWMYECYPLEEKTQKTLYQPSHKKWFETWFKTL